MRNILRDDAVTWMFQHLGLRAERLVKKYAYPHAPRALSPRWPKTRAHPFRDMACDEIVQNTFCF